MTAITVIPITANASEFRFVVGREYVMRNIKAMARKNHFLRKKMKKIYRNIMFQDEEKFITLEGKLHHVFLFDTISELIIIWLKSISFV